VEGQVVDARGDPVAGARVARGSIPAYLPAGKLPPEVVLTNRRGEFKLEEVPPGDVILEAYATDVGRGRSVGVHVDSGRTTDRVRISLAAAEGDAPVEAVLGAGVAVVLDDRAGGTGVRIASVASGSEAERAGLLPGDRLLTVDGQRVTSAKEARARLSGPAAEDMVIELLRGQERQKLRLVRERVQR
jgi:S1-C subfamily serine protease